ncbi:hypothetical protein FJT64_014093 [Amphibalanus amphitrite]|uniref:Uncharacterized protein n=1 Tax=Amphibalanus amphitrite TaxID=1232801 RepID=A0A6A4V0L2_AMPAM|nr:hypothetical protein FJT64_014093 [Amphibalanus amphitrite]
MLALDSRRAAPTRAMPSGSALTAALTSQAAHITFQPPTQTGVIRVGRLCRLTRPFLPACLRYATRHHVLYEKHQREFYQRSRRCCR